VFGKAITLGPAENGRRLLSVRRRTVRVVALVGVEHGYWLRRELAKEKDLEVLDTAALLAR
jgi:hypothetical protein